LLSASVPPEAAVWTRDASLLPAATDVRRQAVVAGAFVVPARFFEIADAAACYRDDGRWALLYRVLWRLTHGEPSLLDVVVDDDVYRLLAMEKAVTRDAHKMKAFVRFRRVVADAGEHYVAWHRPDHRVVRRTAPWFRHRFGAMRWSILTPDASAAWVDGALRFGPGVPSSAAPRDDELKELWRTYYASTFNPARVSVAAMRREMPLKHWPTLPETTLIPDLLREAPARVEEMMRRQAKQAAEKVASPMTAGEADEASCPTGTSAAEFIPKTTSLQTLRKAAQSCRGCKLYCNATQAVFGEGPKDATVMFVGEQPGDQEDRAGRPFVGPAGQLLDAAFEEAGIPRDETYVTNAVKHFKWEPRGTRRLHAKPSAREVGACRPWLETEIAVVKPRMIVCLGATAAQSLMGPAFRITRQRGQPFTDTQWAPWVMATIHPSAILRIPEADMRDQAHAEFVGDLKKVARQLQLDRASG
jgi:probable DNA metabolism protein